MLGGAIAQRRHKDAAPSARARRRDPSKSFRGSGTVHSAPASRPAAMGRMNIHARLTPTMHAPWVHLPVVVVIDGRPAIAVERGSSNPVMAVTKADTGRRHDAFTGQADQPPRRAHLPPSGTVQSCARAWLVSEMDEQGTVMGGLARRPEECHAAVAVFGLPAGARVLVSWRMAWWAPRATRASGSTSGPW